MIQYQTPLQESETDPTLTVWDFDFEPTRNLNTEEKATMRLYYNNLMEMYNAMQYKDKRRNVFLSEIKKVMEFRIRHNF